MFDVVFISKDELNAEDNWQVLCDMMPGAKRLHGVNGLHRAHICAARMVDTPMFYAVDGDAMMEPGFTFDLSVPDHQLDHVHVFRARNPINDLVYGYGAVKLLPTADVLQLEDRKLKPDMTSSINRKYKIVHKVSNTTMFNTDPFNTWRSAFRECAKLSSGVIDGQIDAETAKRLDIWCTIGEDRPNGRWCLAGASAGRQFGDSNRGTDRMMLINDYAWLREQFEKDAA